MLFFVRVVRGPLPRRIPHRVVETRDFVKSENHIEHFSYLIVAKGPAALMVEDRPQKSDLSREELNLLLEKEPSLIEEPHEQSYARILSAPRLRKSHLLLDLCTPEGQIETRTIGKSKGLAGGYPQGQNARWGDLWQYPPPLNEEQKQAILKRRESMWWSGRKKHRRRKTKTDKDKHTDRPDREKTREMREEAADKRHERTEQNMSQSTRALT